MVVQVGAPAAAEADLLIENVIGVFGIPMGLGLNFLINGKTFEEYFCTLQGRLRAKAPLVTSEPESTYDISCNVKGGGITGQADAVRLGLARALRKLNMALDEPFREEGLLTRDARMVERKKYGRRGARRGFQFSKR